MRVIVCKDCGAGNGEFGLRCTACQALLPGDSAGTSGAGPRQAVPGYGLLGKMLGPYRVRSLLGRGGMGSVYRAEHGRTGVAVALKIASRAHEWLLQGLRREIQALSRLRHPGIVRILGQGLHEGLPWYAMELVEGVTLRRPAEARSEGAPTAEPWWTRSLQGASAGETGTGLSRGLPRSGGQASPPRGSGDPGRAGLSVEAVLTLARRLCAPLAYLHGEGVVHRDLKPENILLRPFGDSGEKHGASDLIGMPVIVDFGLTAPLTGEMSREALELDFHGAGTAAYMAPEQIRGEMADARADLYALGCVLYELLTGCKPFEGRSLGEVLREHLHEAPVPPSVRAPEAVGMRRDAAGLDALVLRLLEKEPRRRLGHADDVAAALAELGAQDGLAAEGPRPRAYLYRPGFGGREGPMRELRAALERLQAGRGGLLLVSGESGVGKTRLLLELAKEARERGAQVLAGECVPAVPFSGVESARAPRPLVPQRRNELILCDLWQEKKTGRR